MRSADIDIRLMDYHLDNLAHESEVLKAKLDQDTHSENNPDVIELPPYNPSRSEDHKTPH